MAFNPIEALQRNASSLLRAHKASGVAFAAVAGHIGVEARTACVAHARVRLTLVRTIAIPPACLPEPSTSAR